MQTENSKAGELKMESSKKDEDLDQMLEEKEKELEAIKAEMAQVHKVTQELTRDLHEMSNH
jgi:F0F1-type ATP synthase assembly protein I